MPPCSEGNWQWRAVFCVVRRLFERDRQHYLGAVAEQVCLAQEVGIDEDEN